MVSRISAVTQNILTVEASSAGDAILVGEPAWFEWLLTADAFRYVGPDGHFTARKEPASHGRGGSYWKAYRRSRSRLRRAYLGASTGLSQDRLAGAAARLAVSDGSSLRRARSIGQAGPEPDLGPTTHLGLLGRFDLTDGDVAPRKQAA